MGKDCSWQKGALGLQQWPWFRGTWQTLTGCCYSHLLLLFLEIQELLFIWKSLKISGRICSGAVEPGAHAMLCAFVNMKLPFSGTSNMFLGRKCRQPSSVGCTDLCFPSRLSLRVSQEHLRLVSQRNPIKITPHCLDCMQLWLFLCPGLVLLTNSCYLLWTGFTQHRQSTQGWLRQYGICRTLSAWLDPKAHFWDKEWASWGGNSGQFRMKCALFYLFWK